MLEFAVWRQAGNVDGTRGAQLEERSKASSKLELRSVAQGGGFARMFALGKETFIRMDPAWCQHWHRMGLGAAKEQEASVCTCSLSVFFWGQGGDSSLPCLLSLTGGMQGAGGMQTCGSAAASGGCLDHSG